MPKFTIKINSILGGTSDSLYYGKEDQFHASIGIDPDLGGTTENKTANILYPSAYVDFTGVKLDATPMWMITNPKNALFYVSMNNGKVLSYSSVFGSETDVGQTAATVPADDTYNGDGSGAAYYNNYIYFTVNAGSGGDKGDISRLGPMDGTPGLTNGVWSAATLGSQTELNDFTYPSKQSVEYPNHPMHAHVDNKLYFGDFKDGRGMIHFIKTKKVTNEGDTNDGSTYNALDLPSGYTPIDIESYGNDLVILANIAGSDVTLIQGMAMLFFWDTVSDSFYRAVPLPDPFGSALLNKKGQLYIFSGNLNSGQRISQYMGGYTMKTLTMAETGETCMAGAVDAIGDRIVWGSRVTYPANSSCVLALGYKGNPIPAFHNIINSDAVAGDDSRVTCLKYAQHASLLSPRLIVGWKDTSNRGIDKIGATANHAYLRSLYYNIGKPFRINKLILSLEKAVTTNMTLIPTFRVDDGSSTEAQTTINSTNYAGSERRIVQYPTIEGLNNLSLELKWTGTAQLPVTLPIIIEGETLEDRTD